MNNQSLAQQLVQGKVQVATVNGQQVLIRPTGNNQAQIVAQLTTSTLAQAVGGNTTTNVMSPLKQVRFFFMKLLETKKINFNTLNNVCVIWPPCFTDNCHYDRKNCHFDRGYDIQYY